MFRYSAYQLILSSELPLPELSLAEDAIGEEQAQISIVFGPANRASVPHGGVQGLYYHIQAQVCWLEIPNLTRFLIKQGREIIVEPFPHVDEASLRLFLYTVCLPLVLIYHNFFLLHGGAIHTKEQGVAFLANFGQGKSTLLASLLKYECSFLSDDLCVLNQEGFIMPGIAHIQLQEDAINNLKIEKMSLQLLRSGLAKWLVPVQPAFYSQPSLLNRVYIINPSNGSDLVLRPLVGLNKIHYLKKYTYHPLFVKALGKEKLYFKQCAYLAAHTQVICVDRPRQAFLWDEFAQLIAQDIQIKVLECQ